MNKKKKLEKENKELRKKLKRYKGLLVDKFGSAKGGNYPPERGFTPRSGPSMILASEFDGDPLDRFDAFDYDGDYGCPDGCGCDDCGCTGTRYSSCDESDTKTDPDENLSPIETLLKYGTRIVARLGSACYKQNRSFNDVNKLGFVNMKPVLGKAIRQITSQCPSLEFIFDEAQIPGPRPKLIINFTIYRSYYNDSGELNVGNVPVQIEIPLLDLYCPSHVIKVVRDSIRMKVHLIAELNHMYEIEDVSTKIWVNNVADYMLGMFITSCMCRCVMNVPDWKNAFGKAFLRDEIYLDNERSGVAVVFQTLYFTTATGGYNEANEYIVPIIDGKIVDPEELKERST